MSRSKRKENIDNFLVATPSHKDLSVSKIVSKFEASPMAKCGKKKNSNSKAEDLELESEQESDPDDSNTEDDPNDTKILRLLV